MRSTPHPYHILILFIGLMASPVQAQLGQLDPAFDAGTGFGATSPYDRIVNAIQLQPDGKIIVGGGFESYNGVSRNRIARLNADGSLDATFAPGTGFNAEESHFHVLALALQADGKILAGGTFSNFNGTPRGSIVRLNANGTLDPTFGTIGIEGAPFQWVYSIHVQDDGKVLVAGYFNNYEGQELFSIIRLNSNGTLDPSFQPGLGPDNEIFCMAVQHDGKILLGGAFTTFNNIPAGKIVRLFSDGSIDPSFQPGGGFNGSVHNITLMPYDGRMLIGGGFTEFDGEARNGLVKLDEWGNYEETFQSGPDPDGPAIVRTIAPRSVHDFIIGGQFTSFAGAPLQRIAQLAPYGDLNLGFDPGTGFNDVYPNSYEGGVLASATTSDGNVIVGGTFTTYNGMSAPLIAKIVSNCNMFSPCDDGDPSTVNDMVQWNCECSGTSITGCEQVLMIELTTDGYGYETGWEIGFIGPDTGTVFCEGAGIFDYSTFTTACCIPDGCYEFYLYDSAGDGIFNGGYVLRTLSGQRIIDNRNNFTDGSVSAISGGQGFCLPIGTDKLIHTSCDKEYWDTNEFIVASLNPVVSAEWVSGAPNSAQDTDSGYEFWFFDPNGSYSYRHFRSHATSHGYPATGPARAAHLRLNNWAPVNHIPENMLLNVRVRGVVNGTALEWGPACRFRLDPAAAACPPTKLMDIPGNKFLSCGQYRQWATNRYAHARPVSGATQYQFRFRRPAEGYQVVRTTNDYFVRLFWPSSAGAPLVNGSQYEVDVRAFKNGQWCAWGDICTLNIGMPPAIQGATLSSKMIDDTMDSMAELTMWPNPNHGDQLWLHLTYVPEGTLTVSVDIFDLFGKRVIARTIAVQDNSINTVIGLEGQLAAGMYMVNITAGDETLSRRLVVQP